MTRADDEFDLADAPMPRYELLDIERYNRLTVQTSAAVPGAATSARAPSC